MPQDSTAAQLVEASPAALWRQIDALIDGFFAMLPTLGIALVVFGLFYLIAKLVRAGLKRVTTGRRGAHVGLVLGRVAQAAILFLGLVIAVSIVVPSIGGAELLQLLGVGGVAFGFAFKDILQNFVAGLLILFNQPFRIGDQIVYRDFEGTVENIETRATIVRTYDGTRVLIPNGELFTNAMRVNTAYTARRSSYDVGIGYGDDMEQAAEVFLEAVRKVEGVLEDPAPDVLFHDLGDHALALRLRWWTASPRTDMVRNKSEVVRAVRRAADAHGIDLPFPTQVVLFHDQTDETDGDRRTQREGWPARPAEGDGPRPRWKAQAEG